MTSTVRGFAPHRRRRHRARLLGFPAIVKSQTLTTVNVGIIPVDVAANVYYAQDLGYFTQAGLNVTIQPLASGPALAQRFKAARSISACRTSRRSAWRGCAVYRSGS